MAVIRSEGRLASVHRAQASAFPAVRGHHGYTATYEEIYRTQPAVRTVVAFLGRNVASLGLKVYEKVSATDRRAAGDHPLAILLRQPNAFTTTYRLINDLVCDYALYDRAYWAKVEAPDGRLLLQRIPPKWVKLIGANWVRPDGFEVAGSGPPVKFPRDQIVYFHGYDPTDVQGGVSAIESLRQTLSEEDHANRYRAKFWQNSARVSGVLQRPPEASGRNWSNEARKRFKEDWQATFTGDGPNVGGTPVLEDGMEFVPLSHSARDAQYVEARKLTNEEVANAYHIPPPMVGQLDNATYSNITEQHKQLYQDTLGPWLTQIQQEIWLQLLGEFEQDEAARLRFYVEFNLSEKLRGSFEERAQSIQSAVGAPWLTRNEARALDNRPQIDGGDGLVTPLNVLIGGQASATDSAPPPKALDVPHVKAQPQASQFGPPRVTYVAKHREVLEAYFARQERSVLARLGAKAGPADEVFARDRWDQELFDDLLPLAYLTADDYARYTAEAYGTGGVTVELMGGWLQRSSRVAAASINGGVFDELNGALAAGDAPGAARDVYAKAQSMVVPLWAQTRTTTCANFGATEAAKQGGLRQKVWQVTSSNPRRSHAAMNGQTVSVDETFSNGAKWPGDPSLPAEEVANCSCEVTFR